jgi:hypothetical protein
MAQQPASAAGYVQIGTLGTNVVSDIPVNLQSVIIGGTFVGSVEFYDTTTTAGTATSNLIFNLGIPLTNTYRSIPLGLRTKRGLVTVQTGTPVMTFTID